MRTFYIFKINKKFIAVARNMPENIYTLLNSIYTYKSKDIVVAFDLFNEICLPINMEFFNKYIYDKLKNDEDYTKFINTHMYHNYFSGEESKLIIYKSHMRIKSNEENNVFLCNLKEITDLFVCDFIHNHYNFFTKTKEENIHNKSK